jgi:hypothetical protein
MGQVLIPLLAAAIVIGFVTRAVVHKRRRKAGSIDGLQQHPGRLDQMLDPTDDA